MKELVSESAIVHGLFGVSVIGAVLFALWTRRAMDPLPGMAFALIALALPLWKVYQVLDARWDVTTVRGMAAPYLVFVTIGVVCGCSARFIVRRRRLGQIQ